MVTSSAVVGSSAISTAGCRRAPSRSSRAGACRRRAGAGIASARRSRLGDAHERAASRPRALARAPRPRPWCSMQRLGDLLADGHHRIERGHRLLEDHRDLRCRGCAHLGLARAPAGSRPSKRMPPPTMRPGRRRTRPHDRERGDALAAAGFADDAERLAARERQANAVDRAHHAVAGEEVRCAGRSTASSGAARTSTCAHSRSAQPRVEHVAQAVAHQVDREHGDGEEHAGHRGRSRARAGKGAALGHDVAPARHLRRRAGAEEATAAPRSGSPRRRCRSPARSAAAACWAGCGATGFAERGVPTARAAST